jgi:hypothetical protein
MYVDIACHKKVLSALFGPISDEIQCPLEELVMVLYWSFLRANWL